MRIRKGINMPPVYIETDPPKKWTTSEIVIAVVSAIGVIVVLLDMFVWRAG